MKCVYVRLCTGFSCMVRPDRDLDIDLPNADLPEGSVSEEIAKFQWKGYETVLYRNGGIIFRLLEDQDLAEEYAMEIWHILGKGE